MKSSTVELYARYLRIALLLRKKSKAKLRINGEWYTLKDAARHYCGSEAWTRKGVLKDYEAWLRKCVR